MNLFLFATIYDTTQNFFTVFTVWTKNVKNVGKALIHSTLKSYNFHENSYKIMLFMTSWRIFYNLLTSQIDSSYAQLIYPLFMKQASQMLWLSTKRSNCDSNYATFRLPWVHSVHCPSKNFFLFFAVHLRISSFFR